jgi:hypothetical protein
MQPLFDWRDERRQINARRDEADVPVAPENPQ